MRSARTSAVIQTALAALLASGAALAAEDGASGRLLKSTSDHTKFKILQQKFESGPEVTRACLTCHTEAARQLQLTQHWRWEFLNPDGRRLGKKNVINNFCTSVASNYAYCTTCHIGYGWKDKGFDFAAQENVDCLVCHDTSGAYRKAPGFAGNVVTRDTEFPPGSGKVVKGIDLAPIAQEVAKTSRDTCGTCHFFGGGGDGVKHGDLDSSLASPDRELDVHMDALGNNFTCATCHMTKAHQVPGSRYAPTAVDRDGARLRGKEYKTHSTTCQACHGQAPHKPGAGKLNHHTRRIACQTCHIPAYARGGVPTKVSWNWSTAGLMGLDGKPMVRKDAKGHVVYSAAKGTFDLAENVVPEYIWFNGRVTFTLMGDRVEKGPQPTRINHFEGSASDGKSLIWPVKVFRGKQPYDPVNKSLVVQHMAGDDDTAFWTNFNWEKAVAAGMSSVGLPFSGRVDFVETESMWPITHMVAPARNALRCADCHRAGGRLEKVPGLYIPGRARDHVLWLEAMGWTLAVLAALGVLVHGARRVTNWWRAR